MIYLDFETRSPVDIRKAGGDVYVRHPETKVLCLSYAFDNGPVQTWIPKDELDRAKSPTGEASGIASAPFPDLNKDTICAWNANFDVGILAHVLGIDVPLSRVVDPMALAYAMALPGSLGKCGEALQVEVAKGDSRIMRAMCAPPYKTNPSMLSDLVSYCERDVDSMREIYKKLMPLTPEERKVWEVNWKVNQRGLFLDHDLIDRVLWLSQEEDKVLAGMAEQLGLSAKAMRSTKQMLEWCESQGVTLPDLNKNTLAVVNIGNPVVQQALDIRAQICKSSLRKFDAMREMTCPDGRVRGSHVFHRASTGRFAGSGIQVQNMPRPEVKDTDKLAALILDEEDLPPLGIPVKTALASLVRSCIAAEEGKEFICADYAGIESRVLLWLANDNGGLGAIKKGEDLYCLMASKIFGHPVNKKEHPEKRQVGKQAILGLGYGAGAKTFQNLCDLAGADLLGVSPQTVVQAYRDQFRAVPQYWSNCESGAMLAMKNPNKVQAVAGLRWKYSTARESLACQIPSGRLLHYPRATIVQGAYGPVIEVYQTRLAGWAPVRLWGGILCQNVTQAVARDLLAHALVQVESLGWHPVLHVHDEIMCEEPKGTKTSAELENLMCQLPAWANGLPVEAEGWVGQRYRK